MKYDEKILTDLAESLIIPILYRIIKNREI